MQIGDKVTRNMAGIIQPLIVTDLTEDTIICGGDRSDHIGWWFDRKTGVEVDEELGWGPEFGRSGSYLLGPL